jgi:K+:H+ antiporter
MNAVHQTEQTLAVVLIQLIIIVIAARLAANAAAALRQPRAIGEILAGLLLGPSFFGHFLIVLNIGLSLAIIPVDVFTMLVIMAVGTTIMAGPLLQLRLSRAGFRVTSLAEA